MPPMGARYTFADFLQRLERSPVVHMSPLYHEHRLLFVNRPDMLSKAVLSISWERGLALLQAAYYTQPVAAETYRALLARMLRHNRHVEKSGAGQHVSWQAAMTVMNEAIITHGTALPTRVTVSALRLLAPHRQWRTAIDLLKLCQTNGQLTKPMLLDAAHACATPAAWQDALRLLMHLHTQEPPLLHDAIQSMRPLGSNALTASSAAPTLLPTVSSEGSGEASGAAPTPAQQHVLAVLNSVVAAVPATVALRDPLCSSYLTHLLASTTLSPEVKAQRATEAMAQLPWVAALQLLSDVSEPALLSDSEWQRVQSTVLLGGESGSGKTRRGVKGKKSLRQKKKMKLSDGRVSEADAVASESTASVAAAAAGAATDSASGDALASSALTNTAAAATTLVSRLALLQTSPVTSAAMLAVMVDKLPTPETAVAFLRSCAAQLAQSSTTAIVDPAGPAAPAGAQREGGSAASAASPSAMRVAGSVAATRHPVVVHALLRACARHEGGWSIAANTLLEHSGALAATPTDLLSALVHQLRRARQVSLLVRLLHEHIIPSGSTLTPSAWEDVLECALAHNRALQLQDTVRKSEEVMTTQQRTAGPLDASRLTGVHWVSALSWVLDRQAASREARILKTGTGPSHGATPRHPAAHVPLEKPLTPKMLSLLINICVQGGSPQGALHAMGYALRVDKTELPHTAQIRALLYCMQYDRPREAEALVEQLRAKEGEAAALPLQHLLKLMRENKLREEPPDV